MAINGSLKAPSFKDAGGDQYNIVLTVGNTQAVIDAEGIDLCDIDKFADLYGMIADRRQFSRVLWILCKSQAGDCEDSDFYNALDGSALCDAWEALANAIVNFTDPRLQPALEKIMEKAGDAQLCGVDAILDELDSPEMREMVAKQIKDSVRKARNDITEN